MYIMKILNKLFNTDNLKKLNKSDKLLINDLLFKKIQTGSGYSIRPDLGEINGMVDFTGYSDKNPPVYIGKLLSYVSSSI
jgi:hypothetical protein